MHTILQKLFYISKCVPTYPGGAIIHVIFLYVSLWFYPPTPPKGGL